MNYKDILYNTEHVANILKQLHSTIYKNTEYIKEDRGNHKWKKSQMERLEMKYAISEAKNSIDGVNNR